MFEFRSLHEPVSPRSATILASENILKFQMHSTNAQASKQETDEGTEFVLLSLASHGAKGRRKFPQNSVHAAAGQACLIKIMAEQFDMHNLSRLFSILSILIRHAAICVLLHCKPSVSIQKHALAMDCHTVSSAVAQSTAGIQAEVCRAGHGGPAWS